ncbi:MAG: hypothetical protein WD598_04140 [Acidimicrobiia bacterium]
MRPTRPPVHPPAFNAIVLVIILVVAVAVGAWYFLLRGGEQSEFLRAHERFVAAEHVAEDAMPKVTRFIELEEFDATVLAQIDVMERQAEVFQRLADEGDDEKAQQAQEAAAAAERVITATRAYSYALLRRRLTQTAAAVVEMQAGVVELDRLATEWNNLQ